MSGGAWGYLQYRIEEAGERIGTVARVLAQIEHVLDWGDSGDTCRQCAELSALAGLRGLFGLLSGDHIYTEAEVITRLGDPDEDLCAVCSERFAR